MCCKVILCLLLTLLISVSALPAKLRNVKIEVVTEDPAAQKTDYDIKVVLRMMTEKIQLHPTPSHPGIKFI